MTATAAAGPRAPLTPDRLVEAARALLVEGGPPAVVVREVARRLQVTAPALYRHVTGRDDLLTLLIAAGYDEVAGLCVAARDAVPAGDHRGRLRAATAAFRRWARANTALFGLIFGTPLPGYAAPADGPTTIASQRFGQAFYEIFAAALRDGALRVRPEGELPADVVVQLRRWAQDVGSPMSPAELYPYVMGWQRMLGLVAVECAGQLRWALPDASGLTDEQLDRLVDELLV